MLVMERYKEGEKWRVDEEEDVSSYWIPLKKEELWGWKMKLYIAFSGELSVDKETI